MLVGAPDKRATATTPAGDQRVPMENGNLNLTINIYLPQNIPTLWYFSKKYIKLLVDIDSSIHNISAI